jgi:hypothetical protein
VLPAYAEAFLGIGHPRIRGYFIPEKKILELVHPGIGEQQGWIMLNHNRGRRNDNMVFGPEKLKEFVPYFSASGHNLSDYLWLEDYKRIIICTIALLIRRCKGTAISFVN